MTTSSGTEAARERVRQAFASPATAEGVTPTERPIAFNGAMARALLAGQKTQTRRPIRPMPAGETEQAGRRWPATASGTVIECKLASVGDPLWVREPWQLDGAKRRYEADVGPAAARQTTWRPGRSLPRDASRMTLLVLDVWPERLSEMSEDDIRAEGMPPGLFDAAPRLWFERLWDQFYGRSEFAAKHDPWIWAIRFDVKFSDER